MSALPNPNAEDGGQEFPLTPELIGTITGIKTHGLSSDQMRKFKRMLNGFTGCILIEVENGNVPPDGIHRVRQIKIVPTE